LDGPQHAAQNLPKGFVAFHRCRNCGHVIDPVLVPGPCSLCGKTDWYWTAEKNKPV
jgi:rubrerythrin